MDLAFLNIQDVIMYPYKKYGTHSELILMFNTSNTFCASLRKWRLTRKAEKMHKFVDEQLLLVWINFGNFCAIVVGTYFSFQTTGNFFHMKQVHKEWSLPCLEINLKTLSHNGALIFNGTMWYVYWCLSQYVSMSLKKLLKLGSEKEKLLYD